MNGRVLTLVLFLGPLILGAGGSAPLGAEETLAYRAGDARSYRLSVMSTGHLETHFGGGEARVEAKVMRSHEDTMTFRQAVTGTATGAFDVALTFEGINPLKRPLFYRGGSEYLREDIVGAPYHVVIDQLGKIRGVKAVPHFASQLFHDDVDGAPHDLYRAMLFLFPRFPVQPIGKGQSWEIADEVKVTAGEMPSLGGVPARSYEVDVNVKWKAKYTWIDTMVRNGRRAARLGFEASFTVDGESHSATAGDYNKSLGTSTGELYFALDEGVVLAADIKSEVKETRAQDGMTVTHWVTPKERIFLNLQDRTTVPLTWVKSQRVSLELAESKSSSR